MLEQIESNLTVAVAVFAAAAAVIALAGVRLSGLADRLADRTGLGEAMVGAVLLGGVTSLSGIITSATAAFDGHPELAVSNALGGIAAQTTFLTVADVFHRKANLEHAAASAESLTAGTLLIALLAFPLLATGGPDFTVLSVHPASLLMLIAYGFGLQLLRKARSRPMWGPRRTWLTSEDVPEEEPGGEGMATLWLLFAVLGLAVAGAGFFIARAAETIAASTPLSESIVGGLFTAVTTSLPELVTTVAAVRRGALSLAVGGILGGNSFDVLFLAVSDGFFREGSIYHAVTDRQVFLMALTILMSAVLLLGLLRREEHGVANIGFESFLVFVLYLCGVAVLAFA